MQILMKHPKHGYMNIYSTEHEESCKLNGWTECKIDDDGMPVEALQTVEVNNVELPERKKPGRKPGWNKA